MTAASVAVVDVLNSLIETERRSIFRLMGDDSPYVRQASPAVRQVLEEEREASYRHADELAQLVRRLGAYPIEQSTAAQPTMLEFISLRFLLPKLVEEKELIVRYYENALGALGGDAPEVAQALRGHLAEHQRHLSVLRAALAER